VASRTLESTEVLDAAPARLLQLARDGAARVGAEVGALVGGVAAVRDGEAELALQRAHGAQAARLHLVGGEPCGRAGDGQRAARRRDGARRR